MRLFNLRLMIFEMTKMEKWMYTKFQTNQFWMEQEKFNAQLIIFGKWLVIYLCLYVYQVDKLRPKMALSTTILYLTPRKRSYERLISILVKIKISSLIAIIWELHQCFELLTFSRENRKKLLFFISTMKVKQLWLNKLGNVLIWANMNFRVTILDYICKIFMKTWMYNHSK